MFHSVTDYIFFITFCVLATASPILFIMKTYSSDIFLTDFDGPELEATDDWFVCCRWL
jgi:hypothetical protein